MWERIEISSRIKEGESAINSLRGEGNVFEQRAYSLRELHDLVGVRVKVFPSHRITSMAGPVGRLFSECKKGPKFLREAKGLFKCNGLKYYGSFARSADVLVEIQIVPLLIGLFWELEHATVYKPSPELRGIERVIGDQNRKVYEALAQWERTFLEFAKARQPRVKS